MKIFTFPKVLAFFTICEIWCTQATATDISINHNVNSSDLTLSASLDRFAGAINSLNFRGVQYVNTYDHGREFQGAVFLNQEGQCLNPTEAGSQNDATGPSSTSILQSGNNNGNILNTSVNMAFWLAPGQSNGGPCSGADSSTTAKNTTLQSGVIFSKRVSIGTSGYQNVISYDTSYYFPTAYRSGNFAPESLYFPVTFNVFLSYDPASKALKLLPNVLAPGAALETPIIISTPNGSSALAVSSAYVSANPGSSSFGYDVNTSGNATNFLNCQFNVNNITAGSTQSFSCPLIVGTVDEVLATLNRYPVQSADSNYSIFRFSASAHHFYSLSYNEGVGTNYRFEGTDWHVFSVGSGSLIPLYRCRGRSVSSDHFASNSPNCEGQIVESTFGYASPVSSQGLIPLYRYYNGATKDHLMTTQPATEQLSGYFLDGITAYVPPT